MRVKPAIAGAVVRDPTTLQRLPDEGAEVGLTGYWRRRLEQGDVVLDEEPPAPGPDTPADPPPGP